MPSVNIYTNQNRVKSLEKILPELRDYTAQTLSGREKKLASDEISLRVIVPEVAMQKADTEMEIKAYQFQERIDKQDDICLSIQNYVQNKCPGAGSVYVWLVLSQLGHSAKD
ncbi:TPA: hypothetical protein HA235_05780 [Candidatus Woesearchaeota archaeon]|nr:hypothetical protein [Candidatus Woesearchaeota archaeon]HIH32192.1 hypothetical protein [Candidatus Woesearchaeota archaeon]HIH55579.1 hypothetical protein [Candidatus Woesearchaeota archaeon]HIJ02551.1 hypothetical protein [Candidatus Woesearchaeota archaeon]HIJ13403.1 hypothetical protein [Candidatus Woesearchaeota archaeon]